MQSKASTLFSMTPFKVQVMGIITIHRGDISEMKTGEGKTLTATMPVYLNALSGRGVHVVTVNEYLSSFQSEEMANIQLLRFICRLEFKFFKYRRKKSGICADITYSTNNELGFDYLRITWSHTKMTA